MIDIQSAPSIAYLRDIMTAPVQTIDLDDPILAVKEMFDRERFHHVVVLKRGRVFGVVSDRDVLREMSPFIGSRLMERSQDLNTLKRRVHQITSRTVITMGPDQTVEEAAVEMLDKRVSSLPIVDKEQSLLGIVTLRDIVAWVTTAMHPARLKGGESECDKGVVVIVDGQRCYSPHIAIGRLIREAEKSYQKNHEADSARPALLPSPTVDSSSR